MADIGFHFAQAWWLLGLLALLPAALWLHYSVQRAHKGAIHLYADEHLLPHLSGTRELSEGERWGRFGRWALMWTLGILAMAGPRWDYNDVRLFHPGNNLLVLLDISRSMQAADVAPTRLGRAKQEIQDLIMLNRAVRIGLIAFASTPHVISPITEDTHSIHNTLPAIETDLARLQGSRLLAALDRAEELLGGLPEDSAKTILLISDGDFDEAELEQRVRQLTQKDIRLHALGIGSENGGTVPDAQGKDLTDRQRRPIRSRLDAAMLQRLAEAGNGEYIEAGYLDGDTEQILAAATRVLPSEDEMDETTRLWNERFFWLLIPLALLLLSAFRRPVARQGEE